ncbi:MAG TPA: putative Ig domain-containing protein, partial [Bacteroidales bacterium]|nr:putative Ig domain-containing protein [Bacteroidales bacterium]
TQNITPPTASITNNTGTTILTCTVTSISVTATGGVSYLWTGGTSTNTAANSFTTPGTFTVTVTGANGCTDTESITITQNITPPTAGITNNTGTTVLTCTVTSISVTATGGVSYLWTGGTSTNTAANSFTSPGTYTVTVTGANGCTDTESITITQNVDIPLAPVSGGDKAICLGQPIPALTVTVGSGETADWYATASGGVPLATGTLSYTPVAEGTYYAQARNLTSGCISPSRTAVTLTINDPPVLGSIGNKTVNEQVALNFTAAATDPDLPAQTLTYSLDAAAIALGMTINPNTGAFSWTPSELQGGGSYTVTITVTDNGTCNLSDSETITITVSEVNKPPVLAPIGNQTVDELFLLTFTASATDGDLPANTLTYSLVGAPAGASIDPVTGVFTWIPTADQGPGSYTFTVKVCDNGTPVPLCDEEEITVTVNQSVTPHQLTVTIYLQGTYAGSGLMYTTLNDEDQLPLSQPYNPAPWNYAGTESVTVMDPDVTDWVLIELRANTTTTSTRRAGLLYKDGTVTVDFQGDVTDQGQYYVVAWHRNHLPLMSQNKISIPSTGALIDLSILANCYGDNPAIHLDGDRYGMIAGEVIPDGQLKYSGPANDRGPVLAKIQALGGTLVSDIFTDDYWQEDINLNNELKYIGPDNDRGTIISNISSLLSTSLLTAIYYSEVPGAYAGKKSVVENNGPVNIHLYGHQGGIEVVLTTGDLVQNGVMDNLQFTLAWNAGDPDIGEMLSEFSSGYMIQPQGDPVFANGIVYQVYATVTPCSLPSFWYPGEDLTALTFGTPEGGTIAGRLWIAEDGFTSQNNAMYYLSIWGTDHTGIIEAPVLVSVNEPEPENHILTYPNPVYDGKLTIDLHSVRTQSLQIEILDVGGNLLIDLPWKTFSSRSLQVIDLSKLTPGTYVLRITGDQTTFQKKIILMTLY